MDTKINHKLGEYLSTYDLINKYNIKSIHQVPKLKKIVIDFNLEDFLSACDLQGKEQTDSNVQIQASSVFYILTGLMSYINFNKSFISLKKSKTSENNYSLKVLISKKEELNSFLVLFFIENWSKLLLEDFTFFRKKKSTVTQLSFYNNRFIFSTIVPGNCFFEIENFLNKSFVGLNSKNLKFKLNFLFENEAKLKISNNLIKNLPYFWISGRVV